MLKIRLARMGKKRQPSYRIVVADIEAKRDGRFVEIVGHYNPLVNPPAFKIQEERALYWVSVGAQPSEAVRRLLEKNGTYGRLARVRAGEPLEAVIAEYKGEPWPAPAQPEAAPAELPAVAAEDTHEPQPALAGPEAAVAEADLPADATPEEA